MQIKILGTRGEIDVTAPYHARHSGILVDDTLLFDVGESEYLSYNPSPIFITHLHPDHAYFVRKGQKLTAKQTLIYAPETGGYDKVRQLSKMIVVGDYRITPIPTEHSLKVKSQAYLIEKDRKRVLYTGDLFWIEKKYHALLANLDLVITDGSYLRVGGMIRRSKKEPRAYGHTGIPNLVHLFKQFTNTILIMHFGSWFYQMGAKAARKKLHHLARENEVKILVCYDGMVLTIADYVCSLPIQIKYASMNGIRSPSSTKSGCIDS